MLLQKDKISPQVKSVRAPGEHWIWLTGMGLTVGLLMVFALLAVIVFNGVRAFWPKPVSYVQLEPNSEQGIIGSPTMGGEITERRTRRVQRPGPDGEPVILNLPEWQLHVGNKDIYGFSFKFIDRNDEQIISTPQDVIRLNRLEYGPAFGQPITLNLKGKDPLPASSDSFKETLKESVKEFNERRARINQIERFEIGDINYKMDGIKLTERRLTRQYGEGNIPANERQSMDQEMQALQSSYQVLADEAQKLRAEQVASQLIIKLPTGQENIIPVGNIVHYYFPNQMTVVDRFFQFLHEAFAFLIEEPREANMEGGIFPAIFGTAAMTLLLSIIVTPFGVLAAIYLREYATQGPFVRAVRIAINNLAGVPSIVFGVFGLGFFVYMVGGFVDGGNSNPLPAMGWWVLALACIALFVLAIASNLFFSTKPSAGTPELVRKIQKASPVLYVVGGILLAVAIFTCPFFNGLHQDRLPTPTFGTGGILWCALTLALMTVPVVIVATEESLAAVPRGSREGSLACGASKWQTIQRIVLPASAPGILTGLILAMARGAGEVAPLMLIGVVKLAPTLPVDGYFPYVHLDRKFMHLGFHIFDLGFQSPDSEAAKPMVFATTLFLIILVVMLNMTAIVIREHLRKKYATGAF
ncbi:MAG: ABC transporter permease subunit [Candidatus Methylacidiphilales bacterium]